jgi:predicted Fe-Mo cluster-binding NifX family protein
MIKIAFPTNDGKTISKHFGQAALFVVATVQDGAPVVFERREKIYHGNPPDQHGHEHGNSGHNHSNMLASIGDCQVIIAGGMGQPAFDSAVGSGLQVILTGEKTIEAALDAYRAGELVSDRRRIHKHRPNNPYVKIDNM